MAYGGFIMDAAAELGRNPVSKHQIQSEYGEMSRLTRDGTAEPVSRDQILRHARGQGNVHFLCSADHDQDWQPYPVDPYSAICDDHTYIHTYEVLLYSGLYLFEYCCFHLISGTIHRDIVHRNRKRALLSQSTVREEHVGKSAR